jgi:hypothetical protein
MNSTEVSSLAAHNRRSVPQFVRSQRVERGETAESEALRGESARLRSARESPTNSKGSSRLFEVRYSVYFHRKGKQSEVMEAGGEASR